ncbi:MAG: PP2C family serine/threonine-protein phosphatase [Gemmatimonadota bacterium]
MAAPLLTVSGLTDPGRVRPENQDAFAATDLSKESAGARSIEGPDPRTGVGGGTLTFFPTSKGILLLVADGLGGTPGGATASRLAVSATTEAMQRTTVGGPPNADDAARRLGEAVVEAGRRVRTAGEASPDLRGMGTTITAALVLEGLVLVAQVGDSRGYLLRDGNLVQLTRDQSVVQELIEAGAITRAEARTNPQRNLILQALGSAPELEVAFSRSELQPGDRLLLCSDGLWGLVESEKIAEILRVAASPAESCQALVSRANARGGTDNITALVARVD